MQHNEKQTQKQENRPVQKQELKQESKQKAQEGSSDNYDPKTEEPKWQKFWQDTKIYKYTPDPKKDTYSIDTPPPYASADHLHVGHGMHYSQFEFVARFQRMQGKNVFFPMGYDDNGLPTERYVEKKYKINKNKTTRAEFIKLCLEATGATGKTYRDLFTNLGFSVDWDLIYHTIDDNARRVAQKSFIDLYKKGRLERTDTPSTWCTTCQTTIAQADFDNVDINSHFNDIIFKCKGTDLVIATTRPELLCACVALFFNPDDKRYQKLLGKFAQVPLFDYEVPIMADQSVDKEKGTGLMMVCTFGDKEDIEKWHKYKLPLRVAVSEYGTLNALGGKYADLKLKEARRMIIEDLKEKSLLVGQKEITHAVNVHERCGTEVEFLKKPQWQIKVLDKKEELIEIAQKTKWYPEFMKVRYEHWVKNLQWNWGISRQRYFGVPFPVWFCKDCNAVLLPSDSKLPVDPREQAYTEGKCTGCGSKNIIPEMDVMDTWMTSSCTPEINARWGSKEERPGFLPMSLRPQAHDIIRTWAFYTIVKSYYHHNDIPWKNVMISGHGQDPHGQKMSKSKGNFIVAQEVIAKYSADAFRFWAASVKLGDDLPYQEKDVKTGQKTVTKLWNAARFTAPQLQDYDPTKIKDAKYTTIDKWALSQMHSTIKSCTESFTEYEYAKSKTETEKFFWSTLCDNYLEIVKDRLYNQDEYTPDEINAAKATLYQMLLTSIKLYAPIMPHITEAVYQAHFAKHEGAISVHKSRWPAYDSRMIDEKAEEAGKLALEVIGAVRKYKSSKSLSLKADIAKITISCTREQKEALEKTVRDIKATTRAKELLFAKEVKTETAVTDSAMKIEIIQ
jgi:valyl-tRNA synthetase